jgi:hypothetical protein
MSMDQDQPFDSDKLNNYLIKISVPLLVLANRIFDNKHKTAMKVYIRPLLAGLDLFSRLLEVTLDDFGARDNLYYSRLRKAALRIHWINGLLTEAVHINIRLDSYRSNSDIMKGVGDQLKDVMETLRELLERELQYLIDHPIFQDIEVDKSVYKDLFHHNMLSDEQIGRLPPDLRDDVEAGDDELQKGLIVTFANVLLRLKGEACFTSISGMKSEEIRDIRSRVLKGDLNEEPLRQGYVRMLDLQRKYDSAIDHLALEKQDPSIRRLRGYNAVLLHLFKMSSDVSHCLGRLFIAPGDTTARHEEMTIPLWSVLKESVKIAGEVINEFSALGLKLLDQYGEEVEVEVLAPLYKGFHFRPTVRLATIAKHYNTDLTAIIDGTEYNAKEPLQLTLANGALDRIKKDWLEEKMWDNPDLNGPPSSMERDVLANHIYGLVVSLVELEVMRLHVPLTVADCERAIPRDCEGVSYNNLRFDVFTNLLGSAKIGVDLEILIRFRGEKRALRDVETLANEYNYGEDREGKDVRLPLHLRYIWGE